MSDMDKQPCAERNIIVKKTQLPLSCPEGDIRIWDAHPKIYLPIEKTGRAVCPYCGTAYQLEG